MSAPKTVTANYVVQYVLSLATDPAAVGVGNIGGATDGSWHDAGTTVTLTATTPVAINTTVPATASTTGAVMPPARPPRWTFSWMRPRA